MMRSQSNSEPDVATMGLAGWHGPPRVMERFHRHGEVELNFVEQGAITYESGARHVTIGAGQFALFWAAVPHRLVRMEEPSSFYWLTLPLTRFLHWHLPESLVHAVLHGRAVVAADSSRSIADRLLFRQWHDDLEEPLGDRRDIVLLEVEARLRRLALDTVDSGDAQDRQATGTSVNRNAAEMGKVERMARIIADRYTEPVHVAAIAREVGLHPNYAVSRFRDAVGMSMIEFLTWHRITHAQRLLATTDEPVLSIALSSGFGSTSRFYVAFKRACGCTPREYRRTLRP